MDAVLFTCPTTKMMVQHWLDDDSDVPESEFRGGRLSGLHLTALNQPQNRHAARREAWEPVAMERNTVWLVISAIGLAILIAAISVLLAI